MTLNIKSLILKPFSNTLFKLGSNDHVNIGTFHMDKGAFALLSIKGNDSTFKIDHNTSDEDGTMFPITING